MKCRLEELNRRIAYEFRAPRLISESKLVEPKTIGEVKVRLYESLIKEDKRRVI